MNKFIAGVIQLDSQNDIDTNLKIAGELVREAASRSAKLICMPEGVNYIGMDSDPGAEEIPCGKSASFFSELAKELNVWLHCGSMYEKSDGGLPLNCTIVINPNGDIVAKYGKIHPFDVILANGGPTVRESDRIKLGSDIVTFDTGEVGHIGLSICYDMRFCELYRIMALEGANIFVCPSDFTMNTGKDHWEPLLRARAIENGCYVIAPGQIGKKPRFQAYGHSMIIDPWGSIIACASDRVCSITAEIDLDYVERVRKQIFPLENRRTDIYSLCRVVSKG